MRLIPLCWGEPFWVTEHQNYRRCDGGGRGGVDETRIQDRPADALNIAHVPVAGDDANLEDAGPPFAQRAPASVIDDAESRAIPRVTAQSLLTSSERMPPLTRANASAGQARSEGFEPPTF